MSADVTTTVTLAIQVLSLAAIALTVRQVQLAKGANHLPVVLDAFQHTRTEAWLDAEQYILTELSEEHAADRGYRGLSPAARAHTSTIGLFYDDLGKLVAHGMIDEDLVIGSYGMQITRLWDALAPYVYVERRVHELDFWIYFEDLATRVAAFPPGRVYAKLGLRTRPPRLEPNTVGPGR